MTIRGTACCWASISTGSHELHPALRGIRIAARLSAADRSGRDARRARVFRRRLAGM